MEVSHKIACIGKMEAQEMHHAMAIHGMATQYIRCVNKLLNIDRNPNLHMTNRAKTCAAVLYVTYCILEMN